MLSLAKVAGDHDECNSWRWKAGDSFTMVAFNIKVDEPASGHFIWQFYAHLDYDDVDDDDVEEDSPRASSTV